MSYLHKAVFLPAEERILNLYKGFLLNDKPIEITWEEIFQKKKIITNKWIYFFTMKKKGFRIRKERRWKYRDVELEDVERYLKWCQEEQVKVFIYKKAPFSADQKRRLGELFQRKLIHGYIEVSDLTKLVSFDKKANLSERNTYIVFREKDLSQQEDRFLSYWFRGRPIIYRGQSLNNRRNAPSHYLFVNDCLLFEEKHILFIENHYNPDLNAFIRKRYDYIQKCLQEKGMEFLYFPYFKNKMGVGEHILKLLKYRFPYAYSLKEKEIRQAVEGILSALSPELFYRMVLEQIGLPAFSKPAFVRNISVQGAYNRFTYTTLTGDSEKDWDKKLDWYLNSVQFAHPEILYSRSAPPDGYDAEWHFDVDPKFLPTSLMEEINQLVEEGKEGALVETVLYLLHHIKSTDTVKLSKLKKMIDRHKLLQSPLRLSRLTVTEGYRIFLPDYGNMEIKLAPLPKALFLFYLNHPEGIAFHNLFEHKEELLNIYRHVSNRQDEGAIKKSIDTLVDMREPFINENCSKIRAAFRIEMDEHMAKHYFINGTAIGQPKKIALSRKMVEMKCNFRLRGM